MSEHSVRAGVRHAMENIAETLKEGTAASVGKEAHAPGHPGPECARDLMSTPVQCARTTDTVRSVAERLTEDNIGAMPICGEDDRLHGMVTDRDIVTKVVAAGLDPATTSAGDIAQNAVVTVQAETPVDEVLHKMAEHQIRRIPVIENDRLVGIVSQADLARTLAHDSVGNVVQAVSVP